MDLDAGQVRIARSFSMGRFLGPTKTGRERIVELSSRMRAVLAQERPDIFGENALAFPNEGGGFIDQSNFRRRIFSRVVRKALGQGRRFTPHGLRHTFASLHLSRGTNLLWVQRQGGWTSPAVLLGTYAHFLPTELQGFADALTPLDGPIRTLHRSGRATARKSTPRKGAGSRGSLVGPRGIEPLTDGLKEGDDREEEP